MMQQKDIYPVHHCVHIMNYAKSLNIVIICPQALQYISVYCCSGCL